MIPLLSTLGGQAAISLRDMLMGIPYLLCVIGIIESTWKDGDKPKALLNSIIVTLIIVVLINGFPTCLDGLRNSFSELRKQFNQSSPTLRLLYAGAISSKDVPDIWNIPDQLCYAGVLILQRAGILSIKLLEWFQEFAIDGLIAVSPILLGFLALSFTRSIGINFLMTSLGVVMWHLGFTIVDVVLYHFSNQILALSGLSAVVAGGALYFGAIGWPLALAGMLLVVIVSNVLYLSVPLVVQALLKGANPATAALAAGAQGTATAVGMGVGTSFAMGQLGSQKSAANLLGAGGSIDQGSSQGSQSSSKGKFSSDPALASSSPMNGNGSSKSSSNNSQGDQSSSFSSSGSGSSSSSSSVPAPPSPKYFKANTGDSVSHGDFTATQTGSNSFALSNNQSGTVSQQTGNIGSPQDLMAGINTHDIKKGQEASNYSSPSSAQQRQQLDQKLAS